MRRSLFVIAVIAVFSILAQAKPFPYSGGSGTVDDPYKIANASDILELSAAFTSHYDKYFVLTADIDLGSSGTFTTAIIAPDTSNTDLEYTGFAFTGVFDGNNHTISNMTIDTAGAGNDYLGLFGYVDGGTVKNLRLENVSITSGNNSNYIGGLTGYNNGTIGDCYTTSNIAGTFYLGGLAGNNFGNINQCYSSGNVAGTSCLGGVTGTNYGSISKSCSAGVVTGSESLGGLVGWSYQGTISNCYSTGTVTGTSFLGGLAGVNWGSIINCYSTGAVTGTSRLGGLTGVSQYGGSISSSYFLEGSVPIDGNGTPMTDAQMKQQANFIGWDFKGETINGTEDIWKIIEGAGYPALTWQPVVLVNGVTKFSVTDGKKYNGDKISVTGQLDMDANSYFSIGNVIKITIKSQYMRNYCEQSFDINDKTFKKGRFSFRGTDNGVKKSFKYYSKTRKFTFSASDVNLMGLYCPITMYIQVGDYFGTAVVDETIVNGKKPAPISLMMGVEDALRVDKIKVKQGRKPNSDYLTVKGAFAVADTSVNMADWDLNIVLNKEPYTFEAGKLIKKRNGFGCSNVVLGDGFSIGSADFNFKTCKFNMTIRKTDIEDGLSGLIGFGIMFGDYEEGADVLVP